MLSFQALDKFLVSFIAICLTTHFSFTEAITAKCTGAFSRNGDNGNSVCYVQAERVWSCPINQCSKNNRQYAAMKDCVHVSFPGASLQQCTDYSIKSDGKYDCWNSGNQHYVCPTKSSGPDDPFITCSGCKALTSRK